jgi:hypothetical protein
MGADPVGKDGEGSQVIVDRCRRQALVRQVLLPGDDVATQTGADALVAVGFLMKGEEAAELQRNLLGHFVGTDPGDGELLVA